MGDTSVLVQGKETETVEEEPSKLHGRLSKFPTIDGGVGREIIPLAGVGCIGVCPVAGVIGNRARVACARARTSVRVTAAHLFADKKGAPAASDR